MYIYNDVFFVSDIAHRIPTTAISGCSDANFRNELNDMAATMFLMLHVHPTGK